MNTSEKIAKMEIDRKASFNRFLALPETRFMISQIPAGDNQDALLILLEAAFNNGHGSGTGMVLISLLESAAKGGCRD